MKCDHYWNYEHAVWDAGRGEDSVAVGRYCRKCKKIQTAIAKDWKPIPKSFVDMRGTLQQAMGMVFDDEV